MVSEGGTPGSSHRMRRQKLRPMKDTSMRHVHWVGARERGTAKGKNLETSRKSASEKPTIATRGMSSFPRPEDRSKTTDWGENRSCRLRQATREGYPGSSVDLVKRGIVTTTLRPYLPDLDADAQKSLLLRVNPNREH